MDNTYQNQIYSNPEPFSLHITPRKFISRRIFWPVFLFILVALGAGTFIYLDRLVLHEHWSKVLPSDTTFVAVFASPESVEKARFNELAALIPNAGSFLNIDAGDFLADSAEFNEFAHFWEDFEDGIEGEVILAKAWRTGVMIIRGSLPTQSFYENFEGENILGVPDYSLYAWQSGPFMYLSRNDQVLKNLILIKRSNQYSYADSWSKQRGKTLSENDNFNKTFQRLNSASVLRLYLPDGGSTLLGGIIEQTPFAIDNGLVLGAFDSIFKQNFNDKLGALGASVYTENSSIHLETRTIASENILPLEYPYLASELPASIGNLQISSFLQINNLGSKLEQALANVESGTGESSIEDLNSRLGLDIDTSYYRHFSGRTGVLLGMDDEGGLQMFLVVDNNYRSDAQEFAQSLTQSFKQYAPRASFTITDDYVIVGTSSSSVGSLAEILGKPKNSLAGALSVGSKNGSEVLFFLTSRDLITLARKFIGTTGDDLNLWTALEYMAEALPTISGSHVREQGVAVADIAFHIQAIPLHKQAEAEKILNSLSDKENTGEFSLVSIRDTARMADMTILASSIDAFKSRYGRAPAVLQELVPNYLGALPQDPKTSKPYIYSNKSVDDRYSLSFICF